jgi:hypothetical protein
LTIRNLTPDTKVNVYDVQGHLYKTKFSIDTALEIALPSKGVYIVHFTSGARSWTQKVVNTK